MATRSKTSAAKKAPPARPGKPAKPSKAAAAKKAPRKAARAKPAVTYEEPQVGETVLEFEEQGAGVLARWRERRKERAEARRLERQRRADERRREQERRDQERLEAEVEAARAEQERQETAARAALEVEALRAAEERKAQQRERRERQKAEREEAERQQAMRQELEAAERRAREEEAKRAREEARQRRAAERQAKREQMEAEERRLAEEQAARDAAEEAERRRRKQEAALREADREAEEEADRRRAAEVARRTAEEAAREEEAAARAAPVAEERALVPAGRPVEGAVDQQAELVAAELSRRRSKPVVIVEEEPPAPRLPFGRERAARAEPEAAPAPSAGEGPRQQAAPAQESLGLSIPEAFLLLANEGGWDERSERNRAGAYGGALAGAVLLELLREGLVHVQRDRFVRTGDESGDPALAAAVERLRRIGDRPSLEQVGRLAKWNRELLRPFKDRLAERGLAEHGSRMHLGLFYRSWVTILDESAQERLRNRLRRAIAGGGTPEAPSILLLGLLDAAGLLPTLIPDEAMDYNRKRLNGLLAGRDIMGYKVDPALKALQEIAVRTILQNVRLMTVRG